MKKFNELSREERYEVGALFANWLDDYTDEVIKRDIRKLAGRLHR